MLEYLTNRKGGNHHGLRNQAIENHSKTLSGGQEPYRRREGRLVGARGFEDTIKIWLTESTKQDTQGIMRRKWHLGRLFRTEVCSLHIRYGCIVWCSCGTPNRSRDVFDSFPYTWDLFLLLGCLILPRYEGLGLLFVTCYSVCGWYAWEASSFLKGNEGAVDLRERGGLRGDWEGCKKGKLWLEFITWEKNLKNKSGYMCDNVLLYSR